MATVQSLDRIEIKGIFRTIVRRVLGARFARPPFTSRFRDFGNVHVDFLLKCPCISVIFNFEIQGNSQRRKKAKALRLDGATAYINQAAALNQSILRFRKCTSKIMLKCPCISSILNNEFAFSKKARFSGDPRGRQIWQKTLSG